ncbi:isocitrate lyase/phosphoenolpyruvate mutase family protein [Streptomyces sp. B-S-A8]|uniref:Isocitrate lyase/phosphoenolpyruvate mutase family protein n=1 Tax=Streptomyces solicavernae TaxID=3043614 RepID=A0ABT6RPK4_9ACTN|nr:isocitrate lyase/phosphoenolpyruvate mutase family protein [Streptomyces sp. B-S-A8]MDI3385631.1 isocitrate lyase/phosphoenolpyruvate mutase family protein [Streptomyces sp. B-S-A8]
MDVKPSPEPFVKTFRALHHGRAPGDPLILPGPWDAAGARVFAEAGFPALATPSAGIAESLGYADGSTPADEMFAAVTRIVRAVAEFGIPVSADLEAGYGLPARELVDRALAAGVVGINLEDSGPYGLDDPHQHAGRLAEVRAAAGDALFVNARVDTYVRGVPDLDETVRRARLYVEAGADSVYPILAPPDHLPALCESIPAPVNALAHPDGPPPRELGRLGAARVTFGPGLLRRVLGVVREMARELC